MALGLSQRIENFAQLGSYLNDYAVGERLKNAALPSYQELDQILEKAYSLNSWFLPENQQFALRSWSQALTQPQLTAWLGNYDILDDGKNLTVALVMAGNIPMVGFHDLLCVLLSGNKALIKLSSNDGVLLPFLLKVLEAINAQWKSQYQITEGKLQDFDAVIATGSNNTARYFDHYFGKYPSVIRKNRNAVAVISGQESDEQLAALGEDVFRYFGLGCRNVSKLYLPKEYDLDLIFKAIYPWKHLLEIKKYENNYDYNKAVFLMSQFKFLENGFCMLKEDSNFASPIAAIFYEYYDSTEALVKTLDTHKDQIQCIVGQIEGLDTVSFGEAQRPKLDDYADGVDTIQFLLKLG